jgi:hypothetical protein
MIFPFVIKLSTSFDDGIREPNVRRQFPSRMSRSSRTSEVEINKFITP